MRQILSKYRGGTPACVGAAPQSDSVRGTNTPKGDVDGAVHGLPPAAICYAAAAFSLGVAAGLPVERSQAALMLLASAAACMLGALLPLITHSADMSTLRWGPWLLRALVLCQVNSFAFAIPYWSGPWHRAGCVLVGLVAVLLAHWRWGFAFVVSGFLLLHLTAIPLVPKPYIDVWHLETTACQTLLHGENPYAIRIPDPYSPEDSAKFLAPGLSVNGVLQFGYPYMPINLILQLPGYLAGDVRYAHSVYLVVAAALLGLCTRTWVGRMAGLMLLAFPPSMFVLLLAMSEPVIIFLLVLTFVLWLRKVRAFPYAAGMLLCGKQYMVVLAPIFGLLLPYSGKRRWGALIAIAATAAAVTLPMVFWDLGQFLTSAVNLHLRQPFRSDTLTFLRYLPLESPVRWAWIGPVTALCTATMAAVVGTRRGMLFTGSCAAALLLVFTLSKQGSVNYLYLVYAAMCCAMVESIWYAAGQHPAADRAISQDLPPDQSPQHLP